MKIAFLVIDAGNRDLIRGWAGDGTLPNIARLLDQSLIAETTSVEGLYEGSTWPSLYTGVNPARHGFHRLTQLEPGTYDYVRRLPGEFITQEPFWVSISRAGYKVAVLDVPLVGVSEILNGIHLVEWGSHDAAYGFRSWPPELKGEVLGHFGEHPAPSPCDSIGRSPRGYREFTTRLIAGVGKKRDLTLHYLAEEDWDLFIQVFTEAHCVGHQCWHLHDPSHPDHNSQTAAATGDPVREVYKAVDQALGDILDHIGEDTMVFLLCSHGMAHNQGADFLLEEILVRLGVVKRMSHGVVKSEEVCREGRKRLDLIALTKAWWQRLPRRVRTMLRPGLLALAALVGRERLGVGPLPLSTRLDLAQSECFPHDNGGLVSGIRFNIRGREPLGLVDPGEEADDLYRRLSKDLLDIVHLPTGQPIVKRVLRTSDLYQGDRMEHLPDLLVEWNEQIRVGRSTIRDGSSVLEVRSAKIGSVKGEYWYCRTGDHRPGGLLAVSGPGLQPGHLDRTLSLMDVAPTLLSNFGIEPGPEGLDGTLITEVL